MRSRIRECDHRSAALTPRISVSDRVFKATLECDKRIRVFAGLFTVRFLCLMILTPLLIARSVGEGPEGAPA